MSDNQLNKNIEDMRKLGASPRSLVDTLSDIHVNVKDFGATGNGRVDDTLAITNALKSATDRGLSLFFPQGVYLVSSTLNIPNNVSVFGVGNRSEIKATSPISIFTLDSAKNVYGNRYGSISDLRLNGDNKAVFGMDLSYVVVMRTFRNIQIYNINGPAIRLDSTQNCLFDSININYCSSGIILLNGAGNNKFVSCEIQDTRLIGVSFNIDSTLHGYNNNAFNNTSQGNEFDKCIIERGAAQYGISIEVGKRNVFRHCDITSGTDSKVYVSSDNRSSLNRFEVCTFVSLSPLCINNKGFRTFVVDCIFEGYSNTRAEVFWTTNQIIINRCHFGSKTYRIVNKTGDQRFNVQYIPLPSVGPTANRPDNLHMGVVQYFDTDLNKPIWWNTTNWVDALGQIV